MLGRIVATAGVVALMAVFVPDPLFAQCGAGYPALEPLVAGDTVAVAFLGTAVRVERVGAAEIATFTAERVWKGPVTRQMRVYRPISPPEPPSPWPADARRVRGEFVPAIFDHSGRYIVVAHRLSAAERARLGADEQTAAFGTDVCGDGSRPLSAAVRPVLAALGPGRAPSDQQNPIRGAIVAPPIKIVDVPPVRPIVDGRTQGVVILEITIDETGSVSNPRVLRSIPVLDQAAIDCVLKWRYLPALVNGGPFPYIDTVTINFVLP